LSADLRFFTQAQPGKGFEARAVGRGDAAGGLGCGGLLLGALALAGGGIAEGDLLLEFRVLPPQFLQPGGAIDAGLLPGGTDQPALDAAAAGLRGQAVAAVAFRLQPGDLGAERLGLRAGGTGQGAGEGIGQADRLVEPGEELISGGG